MSDTDSDPRTELNHKKTKQKVTQKRDLLHRAFPHSNFTEGLLHKVFTQKSLYANGLLHTNTIAHGSFCTEKPLHRGVFTQFFEHLHFLRLILELSVDLHYPLVNQHGYRKSPSSIGKSTINGPFSIAMLNYPHS